ncbi:hypothetical protein HYC85_028504 [Camellia sinensis]|uniref:Transmembrane protein n=1 Tax=Camellia sinensis TaxID=4442 RepID=A0A7J7FVC5_CAMSI|nr:hypothetical protein HYC85_028504 [Camellia sinensis]
MSSILSSPGVVLVTAMAVSGTVIFLSFRREKNFPTTQFSGNRDSKQVLRSCLSSVDDKKKQRKKKRVQFAESVKDQTGNGEEYRKERNKKTSGIQRNCRRGIPGNRMALYNGILRDRVQRVEFSY